MTDFMPLIACFSVSLATVAHSETCVAHAEGFSILINTSDEMRVVDFDLDPNRIHLIVETPGGRCALTKIEWASPMLSIMELLSKGEIRKKAADDKGDDFRVGPFAATVTTMGRPIYYREGIYADGRHEFYISAILDFNPYTAIEGECRSWDGSIQNPEFLMNVPKRITLSPPPELGECARFPTQRVLKR